LFKKHRDPTLVFFACFKSAFLIEFNIINKINLININMIIIGKNKKEGEGLGKDSFKRLREFSEDLLELGKEIAEKLRGKQKIEEQIREREKKVHVLRKEIFDLKEGLVELEMELRGLEEKRGRSEPGPEQQAGSSPEQEPKKSQEQEQAL